MATEIASRLGATLLQFASTLSNAERDNLKLILMSAAAGLSPNGQMPTDPTKAARFRLILGCLSNLQPHSCRIPPDGIAFVGRLPCLSDQGLQELIAESQARRKEAICEGSYVLGCGGPIVDSFSASRPLLDFVASHAGSVTATSIASYLYYEQPGNGLDPHVDTDIFSVNLILMLRHERPNGKGSHLVIYPPEDDPKRFLLDPGECLLLFADSTVHAREPLSDGEMVNLLTIGFQPIELEVTD